MWLRGRRFYSKDSDTYYRRWRVGPIDLALWDEVDYPSPLMWRRFMGTLTITWGRVAIFVY